MSDYTDFFPAASGGGGVAINSYTPFLAQSTGNPSGYNSSTGLYTHPDGNYYLKSGKTLAGVASTYPNATQVRPESPFNTYTATTKTIPNTSEYPTMDGKGTYWIPNSLSGNASWIEREYYTGTTTGNSFAMTLGSSAVAVGAYDPYHDEFYVTHGNTNSCQRFNATTLGFIGNFAKPSGAHRGIGVISANQIGFTPYNGTTIYVVNNAGVNQGNITVSNALVNYNANFTTNSISGNLYARGSSTTLHQYNSAGVFQTTFTTPAGVSNAGIFYSMTNGTIFDHSKEYGNPLEVGDSTARTSLGLPLFMRIA
jgi:hypothetical protein